MQPSIMDTVSHLYELQNDFEKIYCTFAPRYQYTLYYDKD